MINLSYEYKLEPTVEQVEVFDQWLEICRKVYNFALAERKDYVNSRSSTIDACSLRSEYIIPADAPRPTYHSQARALTIAKKLISELKIPPAQVLQKTLERVEKAFVNMYERGFGFPRFKKKGQLRSFVFPQLKGDIIHNGKVKLPKIGKLIFRYSRPIPEGFVVKQARVVKKASGFYVILVCQLDVDVPHIPYGGFPMGIDVGLEKFLATSLGELIPNPRFFVTAQGKLKLLQRMLKNRQKGSRRWNIIKKRIARLHEYITNSRKDFYFKLAHHLCDQAGAIFAEDLNLTALARGMLCKHTLDAAWGTFLNILSFICWKRGVYFAKVDSRGTSQVCPNCDTFCGQKDLSERVHSCKHCGYTTDRDVAAAQVVKQRGISTVGHTGKMLVEGNVFGDSIDIVYSI